MGATGAAETPALLPTLPAGDERWECVTERWRTHPNLQLGTSQYRLLWVSAPRALGLGKTPVALSRLV